MSDDIRITGRLISAARGLAGISQEDFAEAAGLALDVLQRIEAGGSAFIQTLAEAQAAHRGLEHFGVVVLDETETMGAGVRLKFLRQDVRQIARLEGEGGIVGADDAP